MHIIAGATRNAETGPQKPPAILRDVPLSDLPVLIAGLDLQITATKKDIEVLEITTAASLPMFTREHLTWHQAEFREALRLLDAVTTQLTQWRGYDLSAE